MDNKDSVLAGLERRYGTSARRIDYLDGLTVEGKDYWFNVRPSNTEPLLRIFVEAKDKKLLEEKMKEILSLVK